MWVYRVGIENAKRMLLTGDLIDGKEAKQMGLVTAAVPAEKLDQEVQRWIGRYCKIQECQPIFETGLYHEFYLIFHYEMLRD